MTKHFGENPWKTTRTCRRSKHRFSAHADGRVGIEKSQTVQATYCASWADALQMVDQRLPEVANKVVNRLAVDDEPAGCLGELRGAASELDRHGFVGPPD